MADDPHRHPRLILDTRHGGIYERNRKGVSGTWAAFPCYPEEFPADAIGDDTECQEWWANPTIAVGVGGTPDEALADLESVIDACEHPLAYRHPVPAGFTCRYCDLLVRPTTGTVEDLLYVVGYWSSLLPLNLWVPSTLTFNGDPIDHESALTLVGEAVQSLGLVPKGSTEEVGGQVLHYGTR